jgi:hypothetical protein
MNTSIASAVSLVGVLLLAGCAAAPEPRLAESGATDRRGLHLMEDAGFQRAWLRAGRSLEGYASIWPSYDGIAYRREPNLPPREPLGRDNYPITEGLEQLVMASFQEVFDEEIRNSGWQLAAEKGPGTLRVKAALVDLVVLAPLEHLGEENLSWVESIGHVVVVIELSDSETGDVLMRTMERGALRPFASRPIQATPGSVNYQARRLFAVWAQKFTGLLDAVRTEGL